MVFRCFPVIFGGFRWFLPAVFRCLHGPADILLVFPEFVCRKKRQQKTAVTRGLMSGLGGSRTRVQKPFQCPSTIIDGFSGPPEAVLFPADRENSQSRHAGSFIIRPQRQSLVCVVSCHHDAVTGKSRCSPGGMALSGQCYSIIVSVYF